LADLAFRAMATSGEVDALGRSYLGIRIWAAPAALATFALSGVLIGLGRMRQLLGLQLLLNGLNIGLDLLFAGLLGWGVRGIATGTLIAEWVAAFYACRLVFGLLREQHQDNAPFFCWRDLRRATELKFTLFAQANIMLRTLAMQAGFIWFIRQSVQFGDDFLASVHVLLSFISFGAFFLDGFALPAENLVGVAKGRRDLPQFDRAVYRSSLLAGVTALGLASVLLLGGDRFIAALTELEAVRLIAGVYLPYAALYVALSVAAFQLDGIFIGTTHAAAMRNASVFSAGSFILVSALLVPSHGPVALWLCFVAYVVVRALSLICYYPQIRRDIGTAG
jgi:MATE family multidrug resistance protein